MKQAYRLSLLENDKISSNRAITKENTLHDIYV